VAHLGTIISGKMTVRMENGDESTIEAGDVIAIPANHDAWVANDAKEPCVLLDVVGGPNWGTQQAHHHHAGEHPHPHHDAVKEFVNSYWAHWPTTDTNRWFIEHAHFLRPSGQSVFSVAPFQVYVPLST
jgi:gentisate 1,2-dioxygenase